MIEEIPVDQAIEEQPELAQAVEPEVNAPAPKKRGRPPGAKNKAKKTINAPAPEEEIAAPVRAVSAASPPKSKKTKKRRPPSPSSSSEEEAPPPRRRASRSARAAQEVVHQPPDSAQIAAEVLSMLSSRHLDMRQAKREKYRQWFAQ